MIQIKYYQRSHKLTDVALYLLICSSRTSSGKRKVALPFTMLYGASRTVVSFVSGEADQLQVVVGKERMLLHSGFLSSFDVHADLQAELEISLSLCKLWVPQLDRHVLNPSIALADYHLRKATRKS